MIKTVIKRDGRVSDYDSQKINKAISLAMSDINWKDLDFEKVISNIESSITSEEIRVEDLQDSIESSLINTGYGEVAKAYIRYRSNRSRYRTNHSELVSIIREILTGDLKSSNTLRDNGNINGATPASSMYKVGSEANKTFNLLNYIKPEYAKAHKQGDIHIHDLDYYSLTANCLFIPIGKLLARGFDPGNGSVRKANSIRSAAALTAVIIQSSQNQMFGGQAADNLDFDLAPYVDITFKTELALELKRQWEYTNKKKINEEMLNSIAELAVRHSYEDTVHTESESSIDSLVFINARENTEKETHQAMEALVHNLNTLMSRSGNQIPFSSINFGLDTSMCGRLVSIELLKSIDAGLGRGELAIFPISIIKMMDNINVKDDDPNRDIWKMGVRVLAHRFYPNFVNEDAPYNNKYVKYDEISIDVNETELIQLRKRATRDGVIMTIRELSEDYSKYVYRYDVKYNDVYYEFVSIKDGKLNLRRLKQETTVSAMGCRTRVIGNINGPEQTTGRGNFAFTTINLPAIAIRSYRSSNDPKVQMENFWKDLDDKLRISAGTLIDRFNLICKKTYQNFPFLMQCGVYLTSDNKKWDMHTEIGEVLKQSTLSIGYIGIYETAKVMLDKTLGVDKEAFDFGYAIVKHIREFTDRMQDNTHLNWSTFATPAENLCGRFCTIDQKRYGMIPRITDKGYYTNSHMLPFNLKTSLSNKINTESPFHTLTNAGHIFYYKIDGDPRMNIDAVEKAIMSMYYGNLGYFTITMDKDICRNCGYEGVIGTECPHCGQKDINYMIQRVRRITGYLIGRPNSSFDEVANDGKKAEMGDRVNI